MQDFAAPRNAAGYPSKFASHYCYGSIGSEVEVYETVYDSSRVVSSLGHPEVAYLTPYSRLFSILGRKTQS